MAGQIVKNVLLQLNPCSLLNDTFWINHGRDVAVTGQVCSQPV